jgi:hypothetical protein
MDLISSWVVMHLLCPVCCYALTHIRFGAHLLNLITLVVDSDIKIAFDLITLLQVTRRQYQCATIE